MKIFETIFDIVYLVSVVIIGIIMVVKANKTDKKLEYTLFGVMAILLGAGDAFHLIPRVISHWSAGGFDANVEALGRGQFITSITMTIFYLLLYFIWRVRYKIEGRNSLTVAMFVLSIVRIVLCSMPQKHVDKC